MITAGSLYAKGVIFSALLRNLLVGWVLRVTGHSRSGRPWLRRIAGEDLAPTPPASWEHAEATSRCIGCGVCDALARPAPLGSVPVSEWIVGAARRPQDAALALPQAAAVEALADDIRRVCPARVDVRQLVQLVRQRAAILAQARGDDPEER